MRSGLRKRGGAVGQTFAESRERREDALLQYEFVRLQLEGTRYLSPSGFRQQLSPTIEFRTKGNNLPGLQIADIAARPIAEWVKTRDNNTHRWNVFKPKLYDGSQGRPGSYGLKVFPSQLADVELA